MSLSELERQACVPLPLRGVYNAGCSLPYGLTLDVLKTAMQEFLDFLGYINLQLNVRELARLETMLMPANFSNLVGDFMLRAIPKHCPTLVKNVYHNGHPDLIPIGHYAGNSILHGTDGIEVKASRNSSGWQGHNAEDVWLLIFMFGGNRQSDLDNNVPPIAFRFTCVAGAALLKSDWSEAGRREGSRRTPTASVVKSGYEKIMANWIYREAIPD
jgi:hypothetical protein